MKRPYSFLLVAAVFLIAFILLFSACSSKRSSPANNETGPTDGQTYESTTENPVKEKSPSGKGYIIADEVNVRSGPGLQSEVIDMVNIGDVADIIGVSATTERIGSFEARWYNIRYGNKAGWCYGEYISREDELAEKLPTRFRNFLSIDGIEVTDAVSVLEKFIGLYKDEHVVDSCIREIIKFQERMVHYYRSMLYQFAGAPDITEYWRNPGSITDSRLKEKILAFKEFGYNLYQAEGDLYIEPDPGFLLGRFGSYMSDPLRSYMTLMADEVRQHALNDAALAITWDQLSDRIAAWEEYIVTYPDSLESGKALQTYSRHLHVYVYGIDNTPICEFNTDNIRDEVKKSYERFIARYADTNSQGFRIINGYYDVLKKNKFRLNDQVLEYINAQVPRSRE